MWVFSEIADRWDRLREEDGRFLDEQFTSWTKYALDHADDPAWYSPIRNAAIYTGVGLGYATWTLSTSVATGFIDTLRLGDGIREGGWGYGKDALRLLVFAGPATRVGRIALSRLASIDAFPLTGTCAWVAAAKALRLTGTKHFARVDDLAKAVGVNAPNFPGVSSLAGVVAQYIKQLGGATRAIAGTAPSGSVEKALASAVAAHPDGVVMFGVRWLMGGKSVGHAMIATRILGKTVILDRTGKVVTSLKQLPYAGIGTATLDEMMLIENATAATVIEALSKGALVLNGALHSAVHDDGNSPEAPPPGKVEVPSSDLTPLLNHIGLEVRSVPFRSERGLRTASSPPAKRPAAPPGPRTTSTTTCLDDMTSASLLDGGRVLIPRRWCQNVTVEYKVYLVKAGDNLSKISKSVYGKETRWRTIYQANRVKLGPNPHDPAALRVGMELEIPVAASSRVWDEALPTRP